MSLTIKQVEESSIYHFENEADLIRSIKELHELFTVKREQISSYVTSSRLVAAYSHYYMLTNLPKFSFIIDQLDRKYSELIESLDFVDIGTGPGTFIWSFIKSFPNSRSRCFGFDLSEKMINQARNIAETHFSNKDISFSTSAPIIKNSTLFFGHSINEIGPAETYKIVQKLTPKVIFCMEIGTPTAFRDLLELRELLVKDDYISIFPCKGGNLKCPLQADDWCHQILKTSHTVEVERISQLVSLDRRTMPLMAHIYVKKELVCQVDQNRDNKWINSRLLRVLKETKFSYECHVCYESEGEHITSTIEILKKTLDKKKQKEFRKSSTGISLDFEIIKELSDGKLRVVVVND